MIKWTKKIPSHGYATHHDVCVCSSDQIALIKTIQWIKEECADREQKSKAEYLQSKWFEYNFHDAHSERTHALFVWC